MTEAPDLCPECGAKRVGDTRHYECQSWWIYTTGFVKQSPLCSSWQLTKELEAMTAERDRLLKICLEWRNARPWLFACVRAKDGGRGGDHSAALHRLLDMTEAAGGSLDQLPEDTHD